jgi:hypothetical protein
MTIETSPTLKDIQAADFAVLRASLPDPYDLAVRYFDHLGELVHVGSGDLYQRPDLPLRLEGGEHWNTVAKRLAMARSIAEATGGVPSALVTAILVADKLFCSNWQPDILQEGTSHLRTTRLSFHNPARVIVVGPDLRAESASQYELDSAEDGQATIAPIEFGVRYDRHDDLRDRRVGRDEWRTVPLSNLYPSPAWALPVSIKYLSEATVDAPRSGSRLRRGWWLRWPLKARSW